MNLIIKGINMPKNGEMAIAFASDENGEITLTLILDAKGKSIEHKGVTEIPTPHGRLIDAEKLLIALTNDSHGLSAEQVITIMEFPAIIEAEE